MNSTMRTFGYPSTLIHEYTHWVVLMRPKQVTLGSLVLVAKSDAQKFSDLSGEAFAEQAEVIKDIESALTSLVDYEKINYLMLMMVDPEVHAHVIPRSQDSRRLGDLEIPDLGWPGPPDLSSGPVLEGDDFETVLKALKTAWSAS